MNELSYVFVHVADVISKQTDKLIQKQIGISLSQYRLLMVLDWSPRIDQTAIAEALGQTEANVSRQIKLLSEKDLVDIKPAAINKRRHIIVLTLKGMQVTEATSDLIKHSSFRYFGSLNDEEINLLGNMLKRLHTNVCQSGKLGACDHQFGL